MSYALIKISYSHEDDNARWIYLDYINEYNIVMKTFQTPVLVIKTVEFIQRNTKDNKRPSKNSRRLRQTGSARGTVF